MSGNFSLELNEDQIQLQKWVHDFAEDVIRPAAEEWDEREEFPWPVVQEAANNGLYSLDFVANAFADPTGLTFPVALEDADRWRSAGVRSITLGVLGAWNPAYGWPGAPDNNLDFDSSPRHPGAVGASVRHGATNGRPSVEASPMMDSPLGAT